MGYASRLWAITSYFNPAGYQTKLLNYRVFRERLIVPLVAVELSYSGRWDLGPNDAEILVHVRGTDIMWQKERLLNLAIGHLPNECDYVAWLDCDVVFGRSDWPSAAIREMDRTRLCQLYRSVYHIARDATSISRATSILCHDSLGYAIASGLEAPAAALGEGPVRTFKRGHAWCACRDTIAEHGFYDRNVIGGGDRMMAHAVTGQAEEIICVNGMNPGHAHDYRLWVARFCRAVSTIGYIEGDLFHLWHGDLERRRYPTRQRLLSSYGYDPGTDIALAPEGCWRWNSPKFEMHRMIREYFEQRQEDG